MPLLPGAHVGPYEIVALLGAGGMGEVYRARDTKLGREVALKILPDAFAQDPDRLARFKREAQVLASLNHPNIAAIYGLEEADGQPALVLELVEGETLAERVRRGPMPAPESLTIARQTVEALDAAHEKGIVHRDLKPANIKITPDGVVKVLDFGLAKAAAGDAAAPDLSQMPTITVDRTRAGMILGTPAYMSPEQARGKSVGKRTDIWAFGCVLYEMLTGRAAFARETISDTIGAILEREPEWAALPSVTPPNIVRVLHHCLRKDHKRRLRDIGDARMELEEMSVAALSVGDNRPASPAARYAWWTASAMTAVAVTAVALVLAQRARLSTSIGSPGVSIERVTHDSGMTTMPTLSADGKLIAYASDRAGRGDLDIWVQQTVGGTPLRLTDDVADDQMPDFSPDGSQIAFRSERSNGGVYVVPALGGNARFVAPDGRSPRFSPDGARLAYWSGQWRGTPSALASAAFVLPFSGGSPTRVLADFIMARDPLWAPDGRSLLVLARSDRKSPILESFDWWWVPLDGRPPMKSGILDVLDLRTTTDQEVVSAGAWTDRGVLFAVRGSLWEIPVSLASGRVNGVPRRLTFGAGTYAKPTASQDGQVAFAVTESAQVVERVSLDTEQALPTTFHSENGSGASRPSQTTDGTTIIFERYFSRSREIWSKDVHSGQQRMVFRINTTMAVDAVISPDGSRIGYTVAEAPDRGTGYIVDARGGVPKKVCDNCGMHGFLSDNRRVLVVADGLHAIRVVDATTGAAENVLADPEAELDRPHASPDDRWLAVRRVTNTAAKVFVVPLLPGRPRRLDARAQVDEPTTTGRPCGWSLDSRVLYLLLDIDGFRCLWGQHVDPPSGRFVGKPYAVRHFHSPMADQFSTSYGNAITATGFLYGAQRLTGNIWRLLPSKPGV